jgi:mitochondrial fission protein ELM1
MQLQQIFRMFPGGDFLVTTSRRTPAEAERIIAGLPFRYRLLYSQNPENPVGDFLALADYVFITEDSTSMISEAVCWGKGVVEILPLEALGRVNKVRRLTDRLAECGCLHRFDGTLGQQSRKIDLHQALDSAKLKAWLGRGFPEGRKEGGA